MRLDHAARAYLGTPFRHQGRNPDIGIDCIGLIVLAGEDAGHLFPVFDRTDYGKDPVDGLLEEMLRLAFGPPLSDMQPGDIVAIDFKGAVRHVGIVGEHPAGLSLIHTNMAVGRVTEARIDWKWRKRIKGVYRP
jgi:cell wall-associated NlpC family hydrolase